jgi:uncharacterized membrane protein
MFTTNREIMSNARGQLKGKWESALLAVFVYLLISIPVGSILKIGWIAGLIISGPLAYGLNYYFLTLNRNANPVLKDLFKGFSLFGKSFITYLLLMVFTLLWMLLFIVPGIIAAISYAMTFFILIDNPAMNGIDALRKSKEMMHGNKYRYFCFLGRFTGWFFLCILSLGIGFLWLVPYFMVSNAKFYEDLIKQQTGQSGAVI